MKIAILGTGPVAKTLGAKLAALGHDVTLGTRAPAATLAKTEADTFGLPPVSDWLGQNPTARLDTFANAAGGAEVIINATSGMAGTAPLEAAGAENLASKIVIDVTNPLDFSQGFPPRLTVCNDTSLGEQIQATFPDARVVKTLNTVNAFLMVDPASLDGGNHTMFVAGNDDVAKAEVTGWLKDWFGWQDIMDLGDITNARGTEMLLPLWTRIYAATENPSFAFKVVRAGGSE